MALSSIIDINSHKWDIFNIKGGFENVAEPVFGGSR